MSKTEINGNAEETAINKTEIKKKTAKKKSIKKTAKKSSKAKKKLVIVESPAKDSTITKFLGKNYTVMASMGHVRDLPKSQLGVDI